MHSRDSLRRTTPKAQGWRLGAFLLATLLAGRVGAEITITGDDWKKHVKLGAEFGNPPPVILTTADGRTSLYMPRPSGDKFAIYLLDVTQLPPGRTRFPVRIVARQVQDSVNGLGIRNLALDPDDPQSDDSQQVQRSFVAVLLSDSAATGPRARDDRNLTTDVDPANTLGGLSGTRVTDPTASTATSPTGQLTTANATLELRPGLNVLRLDPTDPRQLPEYDPDSGNQLFSLTLGPGEAGLQGTVLGGITIRGEDWDNYARLGAEAGAIPPVVSATVDGHKFFHVPRPSADKFGIYAVKVAQLPEGVTRFPVKVLSRQVRDDTNALGIRNLTIDPDDPNSNRTMQVQNSFVAVLLSDGSTGMCPEAMDDLGEQDHASASPGCAGGIGLSGPLVQDSTLSPLTNPAGEITTSDATLELRPGINLLRLDPTDPRDLPAYDPNTGYQIFLVTIGPDEAALKGEAVLPCSVSRRVAPNPYFPGDVVTVTLTASTILGPTTVKDTFPAGWSVVDAGGGAVAGNTITFTIGADGGSSYRLLASSTCANVTFSGMTAGPYCRGNVIGDTRRLRCGVQFSGGVSGMLLIGPIDIGDAGPQCDHAGKLAVTDYLSNGTLDETNLLAELGDELKPSFGAASGGLGVKTAPNTAINPRRAQGILTVWRADADADGRINFQDADNVGALDHHLIYGLVYLDNTTGACLDAILEVGSDDAVKVRLNGEIVHVNPVCRTLPTAGAGDMVRVTLAAGRNVVLIAVTDGVTDNQVRLMIRDPGGSPLTNGNVAVSFLAPGAYPTPPDAMVTREIQPIVARRGDRVVVTLDANDVTSSTRIVDTFPAGWGVADPGGGVVAGNVVSFTRSADGISSYTLIVPPAFAGPASFSGVVSSSGSTACRAIGGDSSLMVVVSDLACTPDPGAPEVQLIQAFAFGSRLLECPSFNEPSVEYTVVHHSGNDATAANALAYDAARGWGYEVLYPNPANLPFGARNGFGMFGPFDDTKNDRQKFPDLCPEELYDSSIAVKNFPQVCDQAAVGNTMDPCTKDTVLPGGARYVPVGVIFRVNVPNGRYRFVAAVGDSDFPHAHRILAEDGGAGPPEVIGAGHVVLVESFDQSQYATGETDPDERGEGVYARVGFNCKIPPPGDGVVPSPKFVNMDARGEATTAPPNSPELTVTKGYIRIHQLQANSNPGPGSLDPDPNGSDLVVLELWRIRTASCPQNGDTHCTRLAVQGPVDNGPGSYTATATAVDDVKDDAAEAIQYTFRAENGVDSPLVVGPQPSNTAELDLAGGVWTITVTVDDDPVCADRAPDASCSVQVSVRVSAGGQIPGDCNHDARLDISDGICLLIFLFLGTGQPLPCGDGTLHDPGNAKLLDSNGDLRVDLSDAVGLFTYLFVGGLPPVLGEDCVGIEGCPQVCSP